MMSRFFYFPFFMSTTIYTHTSNFSADSITPVGLYLSLRNKHRFPCLLESNDYHSRENSKSFIGLDPIVSLSLHATELEVIINGNKKIHSFSSAAEALRTFEDHLKQIQFDTPDPLNGFLSYFSFEYAHLVENKLPDPNTYELPLAHLVVFKTLIVLDHFRDSGTVFHNAFEPTSEVLKLEDLLLQQALQPLPFLCISEETSALSDSQFLELVDHSLENIRRGNVFQLVVSRRFEQPFFGDDFEVYRTLRRLNPSPYLFYLDFENARIFGSSPETQIALTNGIAEIHPIAGTIRRKGNQLEEKLAIEALLVDEKENAEHTMLVDLARNDLSKYSNDVQVVFYKEVQQFSHVIHLVSKVTAATETDPLSLFNGTFPAGTLSGTPKPKALELLAKYEPQARAFYGGAVGFISSNGNANLAIIIRSALSKNNTLYYQAGAGVVIDSIPENELQEVHNKLGAIRSAIRQTQTALS